jgi:hypothetical protein
MAMARYAEHRNGGFTGRDLMDAEVLAVRGLLAREWGVPLAEIGFVASVADGCAMLGESLDLPPGCNVVAADIEYSSVLGGFALRPGVEMRIGQGLAGLPELVDAGTRSRRCQYIEVYI